MNRYILKLNKKFIANFKVDVAAKIAALIINSRSTVLKTIIKETMKLLRIMSGRVTSYSDIPSLNDHPSSISINNLISNFETDLYKLYQTTDYIHNDTQNLLTFNSIERTGIMNDLMVVQDKVQSAQTRLRKDSSTSIIIYETFKSDLLTTLSNNVAININSGTLTLKPMSTTIGGDMINKIDVARVECAFVNEMNPALNPFPAVNQLTEGSKTYIKNDQQYHNANRFKSSYKRGLRVESDTTILSCQFESIITSAYKGSTEMRIKLEKFIANKKGLPPSFIIIDNLYSLSGKYFTGLKSESINSDPINSSNIKIMIPFKKSDVVYNNLYFEFLANGNNDLPKINMMESWIYNNDGKKIALVNNQTGTTDNSNVGKYKVSLIQPSTISFVEINVYYTRNNFYKISQLYLSEYKKDDSKTVTVQTTDGEAMNAPVNDVKYVYIEKDLSLSDSDARNKAIKALKTTEVK